MSDIVLIDFKQKEKNCIFTKHNDYGVEIGIGADSDSITHERCW